MFNQKLIRELDKIESPFYFYDMNLLESTLEAVKRESEKYDYIVHYALKANSNDRVVSKINEFGYGADCVSGNEIIKAIDNGIPPEKIVFAGVGKSDKEIKIALENNIFAFNCESLAELEVINEIALKIQKIANIALRINPNVEAFTHQYITTGLDENKFGINVETMKIIFDKRDELKNIKITGLHFHIGSQISNMEAFKGLCLRINDILPIAELYNIELEHINVGGGLGIDYDNPDYNSIPDFRAYFTIFANFLELRENQSLHFELGRSIIAQSGNLISKALYIKQGVKTEFIILDAGMSELIRPALYQVHHKIENLTSMNNASKQKNLYDVVGPICESSDVFAKQLELPVSKRGDLFAIRSAGAYGEVMSSNYNLRATPKAYYSDELILK